MYRSVSEWLNYVTIVHRNGRTVYTNIPMNMSVNMYIVGYFTGNFNWKSCFTTNPSVVQLWVQRYIRKVFP